ncbi:AraC family transcriptional regulator [Flavobacterium sp. H122]|uniref:helix-turn-helix domain-containing protein n=1 Tax=Flavobacterium sp. H122 TaxID=2529860 RepID=UPI00145A592D|nr:helix-turn-helix domain-containing protein [Flavobacterium sp. H122]
MTNWAIHVFPYIIGITILGTVYPYTSNLDLWRNWIIRGIYLQWFLYIVFSFLYIKDIVKVPFSQNRKVKKIDLWILSVYFGVVTIFLAYYTSSYTSYIVGALSFSFVLYLIILLLIFKKGKNNSFFEEKTRYESKKLDSETVLEIEQKILLIAENELYLNPQLTLLDTAKELNISSHILSQVLNEKFNKSFTSYINELRIKKAKTLLITNKNLTIEGIGYESGFNSKSSFFTHFKKITNQTPSEFQKFGVYSSDL